MATGYAHVGVIGAMAEEVDRVQSQLDTASVTQANRHTYHHGTLAGQRITIVQSRIGKVAAALAAASLIRDHHVDAIVFTGMAGALDADLRIGDVVVGTELLQHDLAGPPLMFARSEIPLLGVSELPTDGALTAAAVTAARDFVDNGLSAVVSDGQLSELGIGRPSVYSGQGATGDEFIEGDAKQIVRDRAPKAMCVDMESAAIAQACYEMGDVPFCALWAIADLAGGSASINFPKFLDQMVSHYSYEILRRMFA